MDIQSDQIHEPEWPHWMTVHEGHRVVDLFRASDTGFDRADGLQAKNES
ncbi:uncharacterized protein METZ01_LOCUS23656 [marine metagenome]|uniref:Uncharacterized protein n=1 Tax=marine metagenome TaxID=408172 RepID=A0A381PUQ6_9ZZZZ